MTPQNSLSKYIYFARLKTIMAVLLVGNCNISLVTKFGDRYFLFVIETAQLGAAISLK